MAVAISMVHAQNGFFMNWGGTQSGEGYEYHVLALAMAGALVVRGGGCCSVDLMWLRRLRGRKPAAARMPTQPGSPAPHPTAGR
jgi:putative oxidoreductase